MSSVERPFVWLWHHLFADPGEAKQLSYLILRTARRRNGPLVQAEPNSYGMASREAFIPYRFERPLVFYFWRGPWYGRAFTFSVSASSSPGLHLPGLQRGVIPRIRAAGRSSPGAGRRVTDCDQQVMKARTTLGRYVWRSELAPTRGNFVNRAWSIWQPCEFGRSLRGFS
jgi:hypothetical protein